MPPQASFYLANKGIIIYYFGRSPIKCGMANKLTSKHIVVEASIDDLKSGASLWVVLYPDTQREGQPTIESYLLKHVLISGNEFWASFGSVHHSVTLHQTAVFHGQNPDAINSSIPCAYAYSSRYEFVCNFSYLMSVMRCYDSHAYSKIHFRRKDNYRLVWSSGEAKPFDDLHGCVKSGCQLKVSITDKQGLTVVVPVHTPEVYMDEGKARLLTECDALPRALNQEDNIQKINTVLIEAAAKQRINPDQQNQNYAATSLINGQFDSTLYLIDCAVGGAVDVSRWDINQKEFFAKNIDAVQVFAEKQSTLS
jgi:hypothetical protein